MSHPLYKKIGSFHVRTIEECSELTKALCKAERFGLFGGFAGKTNWDDIMIEIADVREALTGLRAYLIKEKKNKNGGG